jgi:hypothetical protein
MRVSLPALLGVAFALSACAHCSRNAVSEQARAFFDALETNGRVPSQWSDVASLAVAAGIATPPNERTWHALVREGMQRGVAGKAALVAGARQWDECSYVKSLRQICEPRTDAFFIAQVLSAAVKRCPEDVETASFALQAALWVWDVKWANGIDLHGNSPRDVVAGDVLLKIWSVPDTVNLGDPESNKRWIEEILSQRGRWEYSRSERMWSCTRSSAKG